jgi:hypothetical protein
VGVIFLHIKSLTLREGDKDAITPLCIFKKDNKIQKYKIEIIIMIIGFSSDLHYVVATETNENNFVLSYSPKKYFYLFNINNFKHYLEIIVYTIHDAPPDEIPGDAYV